MLDEGGGENKEEGLQLRDEKDSATDDATDDATTNPAPPVPLGKSDDPVHPVSILVVSDSGRRLFQQALIDGGTVFADTPEVDLGAGRANGGRTRACIIA